MCVLGARRWIVGAVDVCGDLARYLRRVVGVCLCGVVFGRRPRLSCIVARFYGIVRGAMLLCGVAFAFALPCGLIFPLVLRFRAFVGAFVWVRCFRAIVGGF